jgi:competence protein ComEC
LAGETVQGAGRVSGYPRISGSQIRAVIALDPSGDAGAHVVWRSQKKALLVLRIDETAPLALCPGDRIQFQGQVEIPEKARNPGAFDYQQYLKYQSIFCLVKGASPDVRIIAPSKGVQRLAYEARERTLAWIAASLPQEEGAIAAGFLLGDTSAMPEEDLDGYRRAGISHLFAVSGAHVGMLLAMVFVGCAFFKLRLWPRFALTALCLLGYGTLTGWGSSVIRAVLMALLGLLASVVGRKSHPIINVSLAALVILTGSPGQLFMAGFQLSFGVTLGIIRLSPWQTLLGLKQGLAVASAAHVAGLPMCAFWFNQITPLGLVVNLAAMAVAGPLLTLLIAAGAVHIAAAPLALPVLWAAGAMAWALRAMTLWWAALPIAAWIVPTPDWPWVLAAGLGLWLLPDARRYFYAMRGWASFLAVKKSRIILTASGAGLCVLLLVLFWGPLGKKPLEVTFLDVGEGDCIVIRTPGGKTWLVDGGGTPATDYPAGTKIVLPFLRHRGVQRLEGMIMTHPHLDHLEGLLELMPHIKTRVFLMQPAQGDAEESRIVAAAAAYGIPIRELAAGDRWNLEQDIWIQVLSPPRDTPMLENDRSLILRLSSGSASWLLTGDAENPALEALMVNASKAAINLGSFVLKLPHHGSRTSYLPGFYTSVSPRIVISSGGSRQHPHAEVREWFETQRIPLYATRERGAVTTWWNGRRLWVECALRQKGAASL